MLRLISSERCFGGEQRLYSHRSAEIGLRMRFSAFLPPQAMSAPVPALLFLAGLGCDEQSFMTQAGAQRRAAEKGLMLIAPDTSPRHARVPGESDDSEIGLGAGYWLDAQREPWAAHYRMESYLMRELLPLLLERLPVSPGRIGVCGHSVGGHGAIWLALRHPGAFHSLSALAPVCALPQSSWGEKALTAFIGEDREAWQAYDASALMAQSRCPFERGILVDQGLADPHLHTCLHPEKLEAACASAEQALVLRYHEGYAHNYYFIASFIDGHIDHHAAALGEAR